MKILLVDDEVHSRDAMRWFLKRQQHEVVEFSNGKDALKNYVPEEYTLVLSDIQMPDMTGIELAGEIKKNPQSWQTDIVLFTGHADMQSVVAALRAGVYDYLEKPMNVEELASVLDRVAEHQALLRENKTLTEKFEAEVNAATEATRRELADMKQILAQSMLGSIGVFSPCMKAIVYQAQQLQGERSIPVLIEGETGTGKEIIARIIHYGSKIGEVEPSAFVDINCAALPPALIESELFGYESGSFTGSMAKGAKGKFDLAKGGTLFLDEIGELPLEVQAKFLRVLQEKEFYRIGGLKKIRTDIRLVCATNVPLEESVEEGRFRRDLYFRLKVAHIVIPALRQRSEEILPLAMMFLQRFSQQRGKNFRTISPAAAGILERYEWPGNVRELQNVLEYATFAQDDSELKPEHILHLLQQPKHPEAAAPKSILELPFPSQGYSLKEYTKDIIAKVLTAHEGNQTATANYLGISRRALSYRLEGLGKLEN